MKIFIFDFNEDGDVHLEIIHEHHLVTYLNDHYSDEEDKQFLDQIDKRGVEYTVGTLIIKGEVIKPQPSQVVKTWKVDS